MVFCEGKEAKTCGTTLNSQYSHYRGPRRRREREKGPEQLFEEIIAESFPIMGKEMVTQIQEAYRVPGRINPRKSTLRHEVIKLTKTKSNKGKMTNNIQGNFHKLIN